MKSLAIVFCYNRAETLRKCLASLLTHQAALPDEIVFIDDGSTEPVVELLLEKARTYGQCSQITVWAKGRNLGFSDSAVRAFAYARERNPDHLYLIEGDYVFAPSGLDVVTDLLEHTEEGRTCAGIIGYDHPQFADPYVTGVHLPGCMKAQLGEDNVNRPALHKPRRIVGKRFACHVELASNTCFSCYLNWRKILAIEAEFPELTDLLAQACAPRPNPTYPDSERFMRERVVDDGMLSHGLSLVWNRWAIKHGIDRERFGAWLNIKPSVAEHHWQGGMHG